MKYELENQKIKEELVNDWNDWPKEKRHRMVMHCCANQIQSLEREKVRLKRRYQTSLEEINNHISGLESELRSSQRKHKQSTKE